MDEQKKYVHISLILKLAPQAWYFREGDNGGNWCINLCLEKCILG